MFPTLLHGLRTQLHADSLETTQQMSRFVLGQRPGLRLLDRGLRQSTRLASAFAILNAARCYLRMREHGPAGGILACAYRPNERRATDELRGILGTLPWCDIEIDLREVTGRALEFRPERLTSIARLLARRFEPFRMVRAIELLAFHQRLSLLLDRGDYRIAVMSSYSNPWGIALNIAARRRGIPVVLVMHGMPQSPLPRLDYDLAIVSNAAARDTLLRAGCRIDRFILKSGSAQYRPMAALPTRDATVGVLLSKDPAPARVTAWLHALAHHPRIGKIVVRKHPANLWTGLEDAVGARISTEGSTLDAIRRCDLIVAGNSSVHVEAVAAGVPSVYVTDLDGAGDVVGFEESGLVWPCDDPAALDLDAIDPFYARPAWRTVLGRYVNLDQTDADVAAETRAAFRELGV